jgi:fumarate hydratase class II
MSEFRTEHDSMGDVQVPARAYYSAQTQRAVENFPISGWLLPPPLIHALGLVKLAAALANRDLGKLTETGKNKLGAEQVEALLSACREVADGKLDGEFPIDVFQTGSGTSSNMNVNEVIANRAIELLGGDRFHQAKPVHPNDHVNMGQSTNDMFPTAIHVALAMAGGAGAITVHRAASENFGIRLGHLAAIAVFHAYEQDHFFIRHDPPPPAPQKYQK